MPETRGVPEIYADFVHIATGDLGISLGFRSVQPLQAIPLETEDEAQRPEMPTELKGVVRFSQPQAKIFAIMLRRSLKDHEQQAGVIPLPPEFADQLGMAPNEW